MLRLLLPAIIIVAAYLWWRSARRGVPIRDFLAPALALAGALLYLRSPFDLVPDASGIGFLDDLIVLVLAIVWARQRGRRRPTSQSRVAGDANTPGAESDPYEILGVAPGASHDDVVRAYREKMKLYHPDRVNGLGDELQEVAHRKTIEIQRAYEALRASRT